jgi:serine/threonine-protein kinase
MRAELDRPLWDRIATVFDRALEAPAADRASLLDQLCGSDQTIRSEVEQMLAAHEGGRGLIAERRVAGDPSFDGTLAEGARVGPYRIVSLVGAGGMGDVYRAERADGAYRQTVAIKVLRPGYRTAELVRRFRIEREALARLVHPGIARILDGGSLEDGRPYLVLELVDGMPITTYCEHHALSVRDRLSLFLRVASTVQFAHGRLVVHRDIKPSNILVQADGVPRLLDFGIAKLLDLDEAPSLALETTPGLRLLTPEYAAPEQLKGEAPSTATDVYALGVLLFELLTGQRPFARSGQTAAAIEHAILETPPPAPSAVVASPAFARRLRGDLDTIILMALRKEPDRRYVSAAQMAEDVERYLAGRPVSARPDSVGYRLTRFIARNRGLVAGAATFALLLGAFGVTAALQARRTARERDRAERERLAADDLLGILTGLFERADPNKHPGGDTLRVTSLLDDAERDVAKLSADSGRQAAVWHVVGKMRAARGEYARAIDLLTRAYDRRRALFGRDDIEAARIHHEIALVQASYRGTAAAREMLDTSLAELIRLEGEEHEDVRAAMSDLLLANPDSLAARAILRRLLAIERKSPSQDPIAVANRLDARGTERFEVGQFTEAATLFEASLGILLRQLPPEHEYVRTEQRNLSLSLASRGDFVRAESLQRAAVVMEDRIHTAATSRAMTREALALTLVGRGQLDSAEAYERQALALFRQGAAPENWRIWSAQRNLAFIAAGRGRNEQALGLLDSAITLAGRGPNSRLSTAYLTAQRVPFLLRLHQPAEASAVLAKAEQQLGASPAVSAAHRSDIERYAGMIELALGNASQAVERFTAAGKLSGKADRGAAGNALDNCLLGIALAKAGRTSEAREMLERECPRYLRRGMPDALVRQWVVEAGASR